MYMSQETRIIFQRMNCSGCLKKVTTTLQGLPGVEIISADIPSKTLHIRYEARQTTMEQMKVALAEAHYPIAEEQAITGAKQESDL